MAEAECRVRILQICDTLSVANGGPARNAFELNHALNSVDGVEVQLVWVQGDARDSVLADSEESSETEASTSRPDPRRILLGSTRSSRPTIGLRALARALVGSDAVIIHGFYLPWIPLMLTASAFFRKPVFVMPHGALTAYESSRGTAKKALFRRVIRTLFPGRIRAFAVGSDSEAADVAVLFPGIPAVTCGVGTSVSAHRTFRKPAATLRLLTLCRLAEKKRVDLSIRALYNLRQAGLDARLTIAGVGPKQASLERLAFDMGVAEHTNFAGLVVGAAKRDLYRESDVFILASEDENFGIVIAEALAHGLPTVASRHVQAAALAAHSPAVRLIDAPDDSLVSAAVTDLVESYDADLRQTALDAAREHFGWAAVADRWIRMIRDKA